MSQPLEKTTITPRNSGRETGPSTEPLTLTIKTAQSLSPTTGRVPNNAPNPGNAEVPDSAKEADGAPDMTVARELHFQTKLQDLLLTAEPPLNSCIELKMSVFMVFYDTLIYLS